jgi:hypothetical protein
MRRTVWIGAIALVAIVAAIPLWLVVADDDGVRRLGAIDAATTGQVGQLTLAGVNAGAPIPIDSAALRVTRPVGAAKPEESIALTLPLGTSMPQLVSVTAGAAKAATGKVELVRFSEGTAATELTFDLTGVSIERFDDSYQAGSSGDLQAGGVESIVLRYDGMTMTCTPALCEQPNHGDGPYTEISVPDLGTQAAWVLSGKLSVPRNLKEETAAAVATTTMLPSYLLPGLLTRAREGNPFGKVVKVDLAKFVDNNRRKTATYKFGTASITSLVIARHRTDLPSVQFELSSRHFSVTTYSYSAAGVAEKPSTFCFPSCTGLGP